MLVKDIRARFNKELDDNYGREEVSNFFFILLEYYCNLRRIDLALNIDKEITSEESNKFNKALEQLKEQKPIQYIIGETEFYGLPFKVNNNVLIPRPETEELVNWITESISKSEEILNILDIGTGSGCIAIALAKTLPNVKVYALDVSEEALSVAKKNAKLNNVEVEFIHKDIFAVCNTSLDMEFMKFDIIVSNPPYVRHLEKELMKPNVLENEPHLALFVKDNDPLLFYRAITKFAVNNLKSKGKLYFEINEYLGNQTKELLSNFPFNSVEIRQDIFNKDRMIKAIKD